MLLLQSGARLVRVHAGLRGLSAMAASKQVQRCGVIATKKGMATVWDSNGMIHGVTVLQLEHNQVVHSKTLERDGYTALQVGCRDTVKAKNFTKPEIGHFARARVPLKKKLSEFRVSPDCLLPLGTELTCHHFVPGQLVDIQGTTIGKGFQGAMKKHGFSGQGSSHGNSLAHRAIGGIGGCQDPGKVWPGKKMAGRMGNSKSTVLNAKIFKIDTQFNLLYVIGQVPGHKDSFVRVKDAHRRPLPDEAARPTKTRDATMANAGYEFLSPPTAPPALKAP